MIVDLHDGKTRVFERVWAMSIKKVWLHIQVGEDNWSYERIKRTNIKAVTTTNL